MNLKKCVQSFLNTLSPLIHRYICGIDSVEVCNTGYKVDNVPPTEGYRPYDGSILSGDDSHYWLRATFRTPAISEGKYLVIHTNLGHNAYNSQGLIYLNGEMVHGLDSNHPEVPLAPDTDYLLHNYFHIGTFQGGTAQCRMGLYAVNRAAEQLYYDVWVPFETCKLLSESSEDYARMMSVLVDATRLVDFRAPFSPPFTASVQAAIDHLAVEFYGKLCSVDVPAAAAAVLK